MASPTIDFSHFNKFLSSVGLGLMTVAVLAVWMFFQSLGALTLSAEEIEGLTPNAQEIIGRRQEIIRGVQNVLPWMCAGLFVLGGLLAVVGALKWQSRQVKDDTAVDEENARKRAEHEKAPPAAVEARREGEIDEGLATGPPVDHALVPPADRKRGSPTGAEPTSAALISGHESVPLIWREHASAFGDLHSPGDSSAAVMNIVGGPGESRGFAGRTVPVGFPVSFGLPLPHPYATTAPARGGADPASPPTVSAPTHPRVRPDVHFRRQHFGEAIVRVEERWAALMQDAYSHTFNVRTAVTEKSADGLSTSAASRTFVDLLLDPPASTDWGQLAFELKVVSSENALGAMITRAMRQTAEMGRTLARGSAYSGATPPAPAAVTAVLLIVSLDGVPSGEAAEQALRSRVAKNNSELDTPVGVLVMTESALERMSAATARDRVATLWTGLAEVDLIE